MISEKSKLDLINIATYFTKTDIRNIYHGIYNLAVSPESPLVSRIYDEK